MIKAVIFDMDGVIADSMAIHIEAWKEVFDKYDIEFKKEYIIKYNGSSTSEISKNIVKQFNLNVDPLLLSVEKRNIVEKKMENGVRLFPGVFDRLIILKRLGFKIALGTMSPRIHVDMILRNSLRDFEFDAVVTDDDVSNCKPNPDIFLACAKRLEEDPKNCVVIEDAVNGIMAAKRAGMKAVAITNTSPADSFPMADAIISNISEVNSELFDRI